MAKVYYSMTNYRGVVTYDVCEFRSRESAEAWAVSMMRYYGSSFELRSIVEVL